MGRRMGSMEGSGGSFPSPPEFKEASRVSGPTTEHPEKSGQVLLASILRVLALLPEIPIF